VIVPSLFDQIGHGMRGGMPSTRDRPESHDHPMTSGPRATDLDPRTIQSLSYSRLRSNVTPTSIVLLYEISVTPHVIDQKACISFIS